MTTPVPSSPVVSYLIDSAPEVKQNQINVTSITPNEENNKKYKITVLDQNGSQSNVN